MLHPAELSFQNEDEMQIFQDKQKLKEFITCRTTLQETKGNSSTWRQVTSVGNSYPHEKRTLVNLIM